MFAETKSDGLPPYSATPRGVTQALILAPRQRERERDRESTQAPLKTHYRMNFSQTLVLPRRHFSSISPLRVEWSLLLQTGSRPLLLLFQYVRALFEWGHPLPIWPGASLTSADLIESTTWVKLKQAEIALPWQPHYSTLRTHFTMHCDFGLDKWWKGMKSNKWMHFGERGQLLLFLKNALYE